MTTKDSNRNDLTKDYLKDIHRRPLLTAEDEVRLAKEIEAGLYAEEALHSRSSLNRDALEDVARCGREAKQVFIESNLRLVLKMVNKYAGRGMSQADLMQEGTFGLIRAVEKFDYTRGLKFSTYATHWIRQSITRAISDQARTIRIPVHMMDVLNKMAKIQRDVYQSTGSEASVSYLASELGVNQQKVEEMKTYQRQAPISLHLPVGEDGSMELGDLIEDSQGSSPFDAVATDCMRQDVMEVLSTLSEKERTVILMRFGLIDGNTYSLAAAGETHQLSRERIRQIESMAMSKLRHPSRSQVLREYVKS